MLRVKVRTCSLLLAAVCFGAVAPGAKSQATLSTTDTSVELVAGPTAPRLIVMGGRDGILGPRAKKGSGFRLPRLKQ